VAARRRDPHWRRPPLRIEMAFCINCDACLRACPPAFGAIFHDRHDVVIVAELCSGCGRCVAPVCPTDCIVADPRPVPTPDRWWAHPYGPEDPHVSLL
jgi:electron transport complex protein RnfB